MFRTAPRRTHRAPGRAVIDYRGLVAPVGKGVGGVAALGAVSATAVLAGAEAATAQAPAPAAPIAAPAAGSAPAAATAPAASPYANVKLRLGSRGDAVEDLQQRLRDRGESISVDGKFGPATLRAVKSQQSAAGIGVDGVVGPKTWSALAGGSTSAPATGASGSSSSQPKLRSGSRGDAVRTLQQQLNSSGASISVDGKFGPATLKAVRNLQASAGIGVDGVVGPKTWNALSSGQRITETASRDSDRDPAPSSSSGSSSSGSSSSSFDGAAIVAAARSQIGVGYTWGSNSPSRGFDCSGLVHYAYNSAGVDVSRKTAKGYTFGGRIISQSEAKPGDLVAFTAGNYGHIGIYAGNGKIIDASNSRQRVMERSIWNSPHVFVTYR